MIQAQAPSKANPAAYWERRILTWERNRYGILTRYSPFSFAVYQRQRIAAAILNRILKTDEKVVSMLSLGCGSGLFATRLRPTRTLHYHGIDSSSTAIDQARLRQYHENLIARFTCAALPASQLPRSDVVVALGLFDWLTDEQIEKTLDQLNARYLIISISDQNKRLLKRIFSLYHHRCLSVTTKNDRFPRSFSPEETVDALAKRGFSLVESYAGLRLGMGNIIVATRK